MKVLVTGVTDFIGSYTVVELVKCFEKMNGVKIPCKVAPRRSGDVEISFACVDKANKMLN